MVSVRLLVVAAALVPFALGAQSPDQPLGLRAALQLALENNLDIKVEELNPLIAQNTVDAARGAFEPVYFFEYSHERGRKQQNALELASQGSFDEFQMKNDRYRTGIGMRTPLGTQFEAFSRLEVMDNTRNRQGPQLPQSLEDLSDPNALIQNVFSPEYEAFVGFSMEQPLLKGFGYDANLKDVRMAKIQVGIAEYTKQVQILNTMVEVYSAYQDIVFHQLEVQVRQETVKVAEEILKENRRRHELGRMAPLEVAEAQVKVSEAMEELAKTKQQLADRRAKLYELIYGEFDYARAQNLKVTDEGLLPEDDFDHAELTKIALQKRPDLMIGKHEITKSDLELSAMRNAEWPELNLLLTYGLNGLGGDIEGAFREMDQTNRPTWSAGVKFSYPILAGTAKNEKLIALRRKRQAEYRMQKLELKIPLEIAGGLNRYHSFKERQRYAQDAVRLGEEALKVELARLDQGKTTTREVLEVGDKLAAARTREVAGRIEIQKSLLEIWAASGLLLDKLGLFLDGDPLLEKTMKDIEFSRERSRQEAADAPWAWPSFLQFGHRKER